MSKFSGKEKQQTLAARFGVSPGDRLVIDNGDARYRFELIMITDDVGFFAEDGQYVDLKSYALFADGHPLFSGNLAGTLGNYLMARKTDGSYFTETDIRALSPYYRYHRRGANQGRWQLSEIDRDFLIFDFVLAATIVLAAIGVANSLLTRQLHKFGTVFQGNSAYIARTASHMGVCGLHPW